MVKTLSFVTQKYPQTSESQSFRALGPSPGQLRQWPPTFDLLPTPLIIFSMRVPGPHVPVVFNGQAHVPDKRRKVCYQGMHTEPGIPLSISECAYFKEIFQFRKVFVCENTENCFFLCEKKNNFSRQIRFICTWPNPAELQGISRDY